MKAILVATSILFSSLAGLLWSHTNQPLAPVTAPASQIEFSQFPLNRAVEVHFGAFQEEAGTNDLVGFREATYWNGYSQKSTGRRERLDQLRDWLLYAVVSSSSLSAEQVNQALFDVLPIRLGLFQNLGGFEYGETRSRVVGENEVIVLIPVGSRAEMAKHLAHVADEQRKNLGSIPKLFHVFEYTLDEEGSTATLTRKASLSGATLFDRSSGYHEVSVRSLEELRQFMRATNNLTYARASEQGLVLGGRRVPDYRGIRVEEVATLWQSEAETGAGRAGSGFSLDPVLDKSRIARDANELIAGLEQLHGLAVQERGSFLPPFKRETLQEDLAQGQVSSYIEAGRQVCAVLPESERCENLVTIEILRRRFQKARYDGNLEGTEVGMVLFYTDLLMKLWTQDTAYSTPRSEQIPGFPNQLEMDVAKVFADEIRKYPETRLWLGPLDSAFQPASDRQEITWAQNATRVFAVPHRFLENRDDPVATEPNIFNRVFISWWNNHFEEVARYEPEYQRLNEIMKWSELVEWLHLQAKGTDLAFLGGITVDHTNWFPDWARQRSDLLTFKDWEAINFDARGQRDEGVETLPLLSSRPFLSFGREFFLSGGVSLARSAQMAERAAINFRVSPLLRRGSIDYALSDTAAGRLRMLTKVEYEFAKSGRGLAELVAKPDSAQRLRSLVGEFKKTGLRRTLARDANQSTFALRTSEGAVGDLRIRPTPGGLRIAWKSRDIDSAQALGRRVSTAVDAEAAVLQDSLVESSIKLDAPDTFLVKLRGSEGWVKLGVSPTSESGLASGTHARISGPGSGAKSIDLTWVEPGQVEGHLAGKGYLELPRTVAEDSGKLLRLAARPPPQARAIQVPYAGRPVRIYLDDTSGSRFVAWSDLPADLRASPTSWARLQKAKDLAPSSRLGAARDLEAANYRALAGKIAGDPRAVRRELDEGFRRQLRYHDELRAQNRLLDAERDLSRLLAEYGDQPDLLVREALQDLSRGRSDTAAKLSGLLRDRKLRQPQLFLDEVNHRLQMSRGVPRENLAALRDFVSWSQQKALGGRSMAGQPMLKTTGEHVTLQYRTDTLVTRNASLTNLEKQLSAPLYIENSPGLNNLDTFTTTGRQALQSGIHSGRLSFQQLTSTGLARYRPGVILESKATSFRLANPSLVREGARAALQLGAPQPSCSSNDPTLPPCDTVYIVRKAPRAAASK